MATPPPQTFMGLALVYGPGLVAVDQHGAHLGASQPVPQARDQGGRVALSEAYRHFTGDFDVDQQHPNFYLRGEALYASSGPLVNPQLRLISVPARQRNGGYIQCFVDDMRAKNPGNGMWENPYWTWPPHCPWIAVEVRHQPGGPGTQWIGDFVGCICHEPHWFVEDHDNHTYPVG